MGRQSDTDGQLMRGYSVFCGMPHCTNHRAISDRTCGGSATQKKAIHTLRSEGWSKRDALGWCCPGHSGHQRRKAKKEARRPDASEYRHA